MSGSGDIVIVQGVVPDYRIGLFELLAETFGNRLLVLADKRSHDGTIQSVQSDKLRVKWTETVGIAGGKLSLQRNIVAACQEARVVVLPLDPRMLSNYAVLFRRRRRNQATCFWGHAWPRRGRKSWTAPVRSLVRSLGDVVMVYTEAEKRELENLKVRSPVFALNNAIYHRNEMFPEAQETIPNDFIFVGRLVSSKKPTQMIRAFADAVPRILARSEGRLVKLHVCGSGPEEEPCKRMASDLGIERNIVFHGHVSELNRLRSLYGTSVASLSPGCVGLSVTQSLGFGVPMIASRNEQHGPEIAYATEGVNTTFFESHEPDLADAMVDSWENRLEWFARRSEISEMARRDYSIESMADTFVRAVETAYERTSR